MSLLLPFRPETPVVHKWEYETDILTSYDGKEYRTALLLSPRECYDLTYHLLDWQTRIFKEALFAQGDQAHYIPAFHEEATLTTDASGFTVTINPTYVDWANANQDVLVINQNDEYYQATINVNAAGTLTLSSAVPGGKSFKAGMSWICPVYLCNIEDRAPLGHYPMNLSRLQIKARRSTFYTIHGTGGSLTSFDSLYVFNRPPRAQALVQEQAIRRIEVQDDGAAYQFKTSAIRPDIAKANEFVITDSATRQWFRLFLHTHRGRQKPFLVPTWRPDLVVATNPAVGATTLRIQGPPTPNANNYLTNWWPYPAFRRLQIVYSNGVVDYRVVTAAVDNLDGTQNLTVAALTGGTVAMVSLLEYCRFASDTAEFIHEDEGVARVSLGFVAVQQ